MSTATAGSTVDLSAGTGASPRYRPGRTLTVWTEFRRQATRRRTQFGLGFMVALPLIILGAFQLSTDRGNDNDGQFAVLVRLATSGGLNFALFTLLVSSSFLLIV